MVPQYQCPQLIIMAIYLFIFVLWEICFCFCFITWICMLLFSVIIFLFFKKKKNLNRHNYKLWTLVLWHHLYFKLKIMKKLKFLLFCYNFSSKQVCRLLYMFWRLLQKNWTIAICYSVSTWKPNQWLKPNQNLKKNGN